jgi:hypothetical protein
MKVALHVRAPDKLSARDGPTARSVKPVARFGLHLMQMCVAMCISLGMLAALYFGAAAFIGFSVEAWQEAPALSVLVVSVVLAGSMVVWMRLMRMEWRPTIEMAGAAVAAGALVLAGYWLGIVSLSDLLPSVCGVACLAMIGVMLFRVRLYSGHHADAH